MIISERLKTAAGMMKKHGVAADVGTDHGYLPIYLVMNNMCKRAVAMDVNKGPLMKAQENIGLYKVSDRIDTRLGDGLGPLSEHEADSVFITGMGSELIIRILSQGLNKLKADGELILSSQSEIFKLRRFLYMNGFTIDAESMVLEDGKYYQIMHVVRADKNEKQIELTRIEEHYGKCLLEGRNEVLKSFLEKELSLCERVYSTLLELSANDSVNIRKAQVLEDIGYIKEALSYYEV